MDFASQLMDFALKLTDFVLKLMNVGLTNKPSLTSHRVNLNVKFNLNIKFNHFE